MRSIIGEPRAYHSTPDNPYRVYSYGVKEEGKQVNAKFSSYELALNAIMQDVVDQVLQNPTKNLIWRRLPHVQQEREVCQVTGVDIIWYTATARFCFE